jgi:hypothetical protein
MVIALFITHLYYDNKSFSYVFSVSLGLFF